jgi:dTMP kinase
MRGKFIVLEGGEGAGKSSALSWLRTELSHDEFVFTREPGGTPNAEEIRNTIIAHREDDLDPLTQLLLFEAARREHVLRTIMPSLALGKHVISDRFSAATYAYQVIAAERPELKEFFDLIDANVCDGCAPDHTLFLDIDPEIGIRRKEGSGDRLNVFDEKDIAFHNRVRVGMNEYFKGRSYTAIDASQDQQTVREHIKRIILSVVHGTQP